MCLLLGNIHRWSCNGECGFFQVLGKKDLNMYKPLYDQLRRFFVMPSSCAALLECAKSIVCMDAACLKGYSGGLLFVATSFSAENHVIILAFGICDGKSETLENWTWFVMSFLGALAKFKVEPPRLILTDSIFCVDAIQKPLEQIRKRFLPTPTISRRGCYVTVWSV